MSQLSLPCSAMVLFKPHNYDKCEFFEGINKKTTLQG